jgi:hypothetical protein
LDNLVGNQLHLCTSVGNEAVVISLRAAMTRDTKKKGGINKIKKMYKTIEGFGEEQARFSGSRRPS